MRVLDEKTRARLFVVSGPSGVGKGTLIAQALLRCPQLSLTVSATTRSPRPNEIDGKDYYFLSDEKFSQAVAHEEFLEWAEVHGNRYGTLKSEVTSRLKKNTSVLLEIDVCGALAVKKVFPEAVLIFIEPPSFSELKARLQERSTEDASSLALRLQDAQEELEQACHYDYELVNDDLAQAVASFCQIIDSLTQSNKEL